jgi:HSP20 family molecular chaperone IbpA
MSTISPYKFDRVFEDLWQTSVPFSFYTTSASENSHQEINENEYIIQMPLVGISKEELNVEIQDNLLTIRTSSNVKSNFVKNTKKSWTLNKDCDVENITATLENGLLTLLIPRVKPVKKIVNVKIN